MNDDRRTGWFLTAVCLSSLWVQFGWFRLLAGALMATVWAVVALIFVGVVGALMEALTTSTDDNRPELPITPPVRTSRTEVVEEFVLVTVMIVFLVSVAFLYLMLCVTGIVQVSGALLRFCRRRQGNRIARCVETLRALLRPITQWLARLTLLLAALQMPSIMASWVPSRPGQTFPVETEPDPPGRIVTASPRVTRGPNGICQVK